MNLIKIHLNDIDVTFSKISEMEMFPIFYSWILMRISTKIQQYSIKLKNVQEVKLLVFEDITKILLSLTPKSTTRIFKTNE